MSIHNKYGAVVPTVFNVLDEIAEEMAKNLYARLIDSSLSERAEMGKKAVARTMGAEVNDNLVDEVIAFHLARYSPSISFLAEAHECSVESILRELGLTLNVELCEKRIRDASKLRRSEKENETYERNQ